MEYRSPIRLVTYTDEPLHPFSLQTLGRARKKLLAEMALQEQELELDNVAYARNDVLSLFDSITNENVWQYHCIVYTHQPILDFLEQETFDEVAFKGVEPLLGNEGFVSFVSPYFSQSFHSVSGSFIKQKDFDGLSCLLNYQSFIIPEHRHDAYHRIRVYLDNLIHLLKNLNWEKLSNDESLLHFLFDGNWIDFLNKLPGEFATVRDEVVGRMLLVIERLQRKATWYYLHECCLQLQQVECSATNSAEVARFERIMHKNAYKSERQESSGPPAGKVFLGVLWVIISLVRLAGSCNDSSSKNRNYDYYSGYKPAGATESRMYTELGQKKNEELFKGLLGVVSVGADTFTVLKNQTGGQPLKNQTLPFIHSGTTGVTINNKTGYDCVLLYFKKQDDRLKWETGKPVAYSAYIKSGHKYAIHVDPDEGNFNFYFGRKWIRMDTPLVYPIKDIQGKDEFGYGVNVVVGRGSISECFVPLKGFRQTWLTHDLVLHQSAFGGYDTSRYKLLHAPADKPGPEKSIYKMQLDLVTRKGQVAVAGKGDLYLLQSPKK